MKSRLVFFLLLASASLFAQDDQTLFSDVNRIGGWGGPIFEYSNFDDDVEVTTGGGGALVLDDFYLGGYGLGKYSFSKTNTGDNLKESVRFGHGGFWLGYTPLQRKVIHPYASVRFGWGAAKYKAANLDDPDDIKDEIKDNIFVLNPEFGLELNVFSFFRIAATGSYRLVNGIDDLPNFSDDDFSSFGGTLTLRFGGFGNASWD
ncbi:MAG: hypothetical protein AAB316_20250 [Bacteroidota bacterium]